MKYFCDSTLALSPSSATGNLIIGLEPQRLSGLNISSTHVNQSVSETHDEILLRKAALLAHLIEYPAHLEQIEG